MLYIYKDSSNVIATDSFVDYIPTALDVMLDDTIVGSFINESNDVNYFLITINGEDIKNFQNSEHKIKYLYYEEIIKEELCIIKDLSLKPILVEKSKQKNIKFYEKHK